MSTSTITVGGNAVTLVSFPTASGPKAVQFDMRDAVAVVNSVFTGQTQTQQWPGADLLSGTLTLAPRDQADAEDWIAFLMQLRGRANAFQLYDPLQAAPSATAGAPLVDNSVSGGNPAGAQQVYTLGWTANAQRVLYRGQWIQIGYRLYRVLDDVNADGSGKATVPIWPTLREAVLNSTYLQMGVASTTSGSADVTGFASTQGIAIGEGVTGSGIPAGATVLGIGSDMITLSAAATATASNVTLTFQATSPTNYSNGGGRITMYQSSGTLDFFNGAAWYNFSTPALPADAVVTGIYPVILADAIHDRANQYFSFGVVSGTPWGSGPTTICDTNFPTLPSPPGPLASPANQSFSKTELYSLSSHEQSGGSTGMGTALSVIPTLCLQVMMNASLLQSGMLDAINVYGLGYAVYYTSATPTTDPQMPAPFAVPAGSGLAWSLPFSVVRTGGATGNTNTGTAHVVAAGDNGGIITGSSTKPAVGLFRLAKNERSWAADITRLTRISIPFEEYR